ncbi:FAD-dependent oxidoreductase, partial [Mesorhizobium sp. M7D.F.Ca.US.004.03.1.1]|uniref:NAD(P)/FAD-dependent oxidoreductase n=1 Tax=Mesorhizobium sp. M7D.F.Ca.US.004.03.1.1 TaxID=2496702 RepID=UPI0013E320FF
MNGQLGGVAGEKLTRFVGGSGKVVFDTIRRLDIDCSGEQTGWMQPAHTPDTLRIVEARVRHWQALGQPVRLLGKRQTDALTGTDIYSGALIDDSGGQINPLAYARGLARSAVGFGARIFWSSPVTGYARSGNKWHVSTPNGHIDAGHLFLTTNAMRSHPARAVGRSIIPVRPYQVATQPLDQTIRARVLPGRNPVADLHRHTFAYRWSPDNRLITGGIAMCNDAGSVARMSSYFLRRLHRYIPDLPKLEAAFAWSGVVATTPDFMPRIWHVG